MRPPWPARSTVFAALRQFEISTPFSAAPLGCSDNYPRSVAARIGGRPGPCGAGTARRQRLAEGVTEFSAAIAAGEAEVVLVLGSENGRTLRHFRPAR
jgi:acetyl-CoA C-acetyltransferase